MLDERAKAMDHMFPYKVPFNGHKSTTPYYLLSSNRTFNEACTKSDQCSDDYKCCYGYHTNVYNPSTFSNTTGFIMACDDPDSSSCEYFEGQWVVPLVISLVCIFLFAIIVTIICCICCRRRRRIKYQAIKTESPPVQI